MQHSGQKKYSLHTKASGGVRILEQVEPAAGPKKGKKKGKEAYSC